MKCPSPECVLKVGDGRGFIIKHRAKVTRPKKLPKSLSLVPFMDYRLVVTAAHCLPWFPKLDLAATDQWARTYKGLLGTLDGSKMHIWAECLFVDPIADIAVLGGPDNQELFHEATAYESLTEDVSFLRIGNAKGGRGWVFSIDRRWVRSMLEMDIGGTSLSIDPTEPGMSGSPIVDDAGLAVGIVASGIEVVGRDGKRTAERSGPQPILSRNLPGWLL